MMQDNHVRRLLVLIAGMIWSESCRSLDDVATRSKKEKLVGYALSKVARTA
jgi:hypothetical protein